MILPDRITHDDIRECLNEWNLGGLRVGEKKKRTTKVIPVDKLLRSDWLRKNRAFHIFGRTGHVFAKYYEVEAGWVKEDP